MLRKLRRKNGEQVTEAEREYVEVTASWGVGGARYVPSVCNQTDRSCWAKLL